MIIVITDTECFDGEAAILNELFAGGLVCCHIRKPSASAEAIQRLLDDIDPMYYDRVALHQHHQAGFKRWHLTEAKRLIADVSALKLEGYTLTTSIHEMTTPLPNVFSYAFFGPVFDSISKDGYRSVVGKDFYFSAEKKTVPMIALGGVDVGNIERVAEMNFDGAAVLGALWKEPSRAVSTFKKLQDLCVHMFYR